MAWSGRIVQVTEKQAGVIVTGAGQDGDRFFWTAENAGQLDPAGGVLVDDGGYRYPYGSVQYGMEEGEPDRIWNDPNRVGVTPTIDGEVLDRYATPGGGLEWWLHVENGPVDLVAQVDLGDGTDCEAMIPHSMRGFIEAGVRPAPTDPDVVDGGVPPAEHAVVDYDGSGQLMVTDLRGLRPKLLTSALDMQAVVDAVSADGKTTNHYSRSEPSGAGVDGDTWFQLDPNGHTVGMWHWADGAWQKDTIDGQSIANLDAGTIVSGALSGIDIYAPSAEALPRVHVGQSTLQIVRDSGGTDGPYVSTQLGGVAGDSLAICGADGYPTVVLDDSGSIMGRSVQTGSLLLGGAAVWPAERLPHGAVAWMRFPHDDPDDGGPRMDWNYHDHERGGLCEIHATLNHTRLYRFCLDMPWWQTDPGVVRIELFLLHGAGDAPVPMNDGLRVASQPFTVAAGDTRVTAAAPFTVPLDGVYRLLVGLTVETANHNARGAMVSFQDRRGGILIEDVGAASVPDMSGFMTAAGADLGPRSQPQYKWVTGEERLSPEVTFGWSNGRLTDSGYALLEQGNYNKVARYSFIGLPTNWDRFEGDDYKVTHLDLGLNCVNAGSNKVVEVRFSPWWVRRGDTHPPLVVSPNAYHAIRDWGVGQALWARQDSILVGLRNPGGGYPGPQDAISGVMLGVGQGGSYTRAFGKFERATVMWRVQYQRRVPL